MEENTIIITNHAYDRAKERFQWKNSVLDKMALKAYSEGTSHNKTKGTLKKFISGLWFKYKNANNIKIYGEDIYFFSNNILITLYRMPNHLIKHLKYIK